MAWRIVGINNPAHLSLKDNRLVVEQDQTVSLPLEDIDSLILDSYGITTSTNLMTELSDKGTTVVVCDSKHLPSSILMPYSQHSRGAKVSRRQLAMSLPLKKRLWQKIVISKISNQAQVFSLAGFDPSRLLELASEVRSGDSTNRESLAARFYFTELLDDATRRNPTWHNSALNYGYAMVRSHIARHIAARGLVASQGIFHRSELNSFNLADDLIEPFRAIVDAYVLLDVAPVSDSTATDDELTLADRQRLIGVLNSCVMIAGKRFTIKDAVEMMVESFVKAFEDMDTDKLLLPSFIESAKSRVV